MAGHGSELRVLPGRFAITRLQPGSLIPAWAFDPSQFCSITVTADEMSVVCPEHAVPDDIRSERGWRLIQVAGPLNFELTGILASLAEPLSRARVSLFAVSTYDTDYILIRENALDTAVEALTASGHVFEP